MRCPKALLLDFGAVMSVSVFERHRETERILGLPPGSLDWQGALDPATDPLWQRMQRDEITERDYWAIRAREVGEAVGEANWDVHRFLTRIRQAEPDAVVRPAMRRLIEAAGAAGLRLGILSNELELFYGAEFVKQMNILDAFDAVVDASITSILKPDLRSYALAVESLELSAQDILFVDDQPRNIVGAIKAGLQTQYFDLRDVPGNIEAIAARLRLTRQGFLT
jgi:putative hydrolase of the HAD superfamily